jgi:restriction system protein
MLWLVHKHNDVIERFLEIAERKVSVLDEYGDERWDALPAEVQRCIDKMAGREDTTAGDLEMIRTRNMEILAACNVLANNSPPRFERPPLSKEGLMRFGLLAMHLVQVFMERHAAMSAQRGPRQNLADMTGPEFETFVARLPEHLGYSVRGTPATGDQGADLLVERLGRLTVVQVKRYAGTVGNGAVQEVVAARAFYQAEEGWVVTNSTFTPAARELAQAAGVHLVDGTELDALAREARRST